MSVTVDTMDGYNWQYLQQKGQYLSMELIIFVSLIRSVYLHTIFQPLIILWRRISFAVFLFELLKMMTTMKMREIIWKLLEGSLCLGMQWGRGIDMSWRLPPFRHLFSYHPPSLLTRRHNNPKKWMEWMSLSQTLWKWMNLSPTSLPKISPQNEWSGLMFSKWLSFKILSKFC